MSHFSVAVFTKEPNMGQVEALLAPYDENLDVEPYIDYTRQQAIDYVRSWNSPDLAGKTDDELYEELAEEYRDNDMIDAEGNLLTVYNPKSKWDWYQVGGRWRGMLKRKDGKRVDEAYVDDCNFEIDMHKYAYSERFWNEYVVGNYEPTDEDRLRDYKYGWKREWFKRQYGTKENFALLESSFLPYAFLTYDGKWLETGKMGWFGVDDATHESRNAYRDAFNSYLNLAKQQNMYITIIDCHI